MWGRSHRFLFNSSRRFCTSNSSKVNKEAVTVSAAAEELARRTPKIDFKVIKHTTKIPLEPQNLTTTTQTPCSVESPYQIDSKTIQLLERLSLVDLDSKEALKTLQDSIEFADKIISLNTDGVKPLYTVLEDHPLQVRVDSVNDGNIKDDILKNARVIEEDYFVAPPGNIPLEQKEKKFE